MEPHMKVLVQCIKCGKETQFSILSKEMDIIRVCNDCGKMFRVMTNIHVSAKIYPVDDDGIEYELEVVDD